MNIDSYYQKLKYRSEDVAIRLQGYYLRRLDLIRINLAPNFSGKILDLGCGDGGLCLEIAKAYPEAELYAADVSIEGCSLAQKYVRSALVADFNSRIPFPDSFFDLIISQEVIEHVVDTDNFLTECHRMLKKDGELVITTPNLLAWYQRVFCLFGILPTFYELSFLNRNLGLGVMARLLHDTQPVGHVRVFNSLGLKDILRLYNFKCIRFAGAPVTYKLCQPLLSVFNFLESGFSQFPSLASNLMVRARKVIPA